MRLAMKLGVSLARRRLCPAAHRRNGRWRRWRAVGFRRGNDFQQTHVARRIEEMRAKPGAAKIVGKAFGDLCTGRPLVLVVTMVPGLRTASTFFQQRAFDVEILDDGFNDPIDLGELVEVVFKVADRNQAGERRVHESGGLGFLRCFESGGGDLVARAGPSASGGTISSR